MFPRKGLSDSEVREVVSLYNSGLGCRNISKITSVSECVCRAILRGRNYRKITGGRLMNGKRKKVSE